jgi:hypothetical protein
LKSQLRQYFKNAAREGMLTKEVQAFDTELNDFANNLKRPKKPLQKPPLVPTVEDKPSATKSKNSNKSLKKRLCKKRFKSQ